MSSTIHDGDERQKGISYGTVIALIVTQLLLIAACLVAINQNGRLRSLAADYRAMLEPRTGRQVPPLTGQDWKGIPRSFDYNGAGALTFVYTISRSCVYCEENWSALRPLQSITPARLRIIYVDTVDRLSEDYVNRYGMASSAILVKLDPFSAIAYEAHFRPQAELIDQTGRVVWTKVGKFDAADVSKVVSLVSERASRTSRQRKVGRQEVANDEHHFAWMGSRLVGFVAVYLWRRVGRRGVRGADVRKPQLPELQ